MNNSKLTAAREIKKELKKEFPLTKFSVTSEGIYTVYISWSDGVISSDVRGIVNKYVRGHHDSMTDTYEYTNKRDDIPQVDYIIKQRDFSEKVYQEAFSCFKKHYMRFEDAQNVDACMTDTGVTCRWFLTRILAQMDLTNGYDDEKAQDIFLNKNRGE